ncbi:response regulator [Desulfurivibrio alkaliphilus]|uniref:Response regulator receiver protein n=1 Tax=Desulfurivibrio alkaliphilus (strain DSM 19089 / UNIQEM U267 / AHT2) TaxID=589865 RepID=D6Z1B8_DESAT|nr:response regulator [Desulfurivibrio alkaliphilus]ADH85373.1 response regulator receiver protein [Desulfurivibrio alkaliphilus AHT 2]
MRIVIVDDSATARMFIRRCLEIAGFREAEIIEAENGRQALETIRRQRVDLVLTDLTMPVMDGSTLLKWMKSNPELADTKVLVVSSAGNPAKEKELLELGAMAVLGKPVSPARISALLQGLLPPQSEPKGWDDE